MKIAIVDKDSKQLNLLSNELCKYEFNDIEIFVYKFLDNHDFLNYLSKPINFDIVYLDSDTSNLTTLKVIRALLPKSTINCISHYKLPFNLKSKEILLKPYKVEEIYNSLVYSIKKATSNKPEKIQVTDGSRIRYINTNMVYYFESYYGNVYVHTKDNKYLAADNRLYKYSNNLYRHGFIDIHKSILVNIAKVKSANLDEFILLNDEKLYTSVRKRSQAFKMYKEYIENK